MKEDVVKPEEQEKRHGFVWYFGKCGDGKPWTPERKAELRKKMPEKLNKLGEWFFSTDEPMIIVNDHEAIYGK